MPAYIIGNVDVRNPDGYSEYTKDVPASIAQYGGRFIARGGESEALEGEWAPRVVILEFPSMEAARAWYHSADYQELAQMRWQNADSRLVLVDGYEQP